jgi:hypothetical protein
LCNLRLKTSRAQHVTVRRGMLRLGEERLRFSVGTNGLAGTTHRIATMITYWIGSGLLFDMDWGSGCPLWIHGCPEMLGGQIRHMICASVQSNWIMIQYNLRRRRI